MKVPTAWFAALGALFLLLPAELSAQDRGPARHISVGGGTHGSIITNAARRSLLAPTIGWEIWGRYSWERWGLVFKTEQNAWVPAEFGGGIESGVINIGVGPTYRYAAGHMRASMAAGTSTLLFKTFFHNPGRTGVFVDVRPSTILFPVGRLARFTFDPLTFSVVAPAVGRPRLMHFQYRLAVGFEVTP